METEKAKDKKEESSSEEDSSEEEEKPSKSKKAKGEFVRSRVTMIIYLYYYTCVSAAKVESEDSDDDSSDEDEEETVGLLGKRKKPADTPKATPAKKARNGDAGTPQQNGECKLAISLSLSLPPSILPLLFPSTPIYVHPSPSPS